MHLVTLEFCHDRRMLHIFWRANYHPGVVTIVWPRIMLQEEVCAEAEGGEKKMQSHNPSHCSSPSSCCRSSTISVALTLITTCRDDVTGSPMLPGRYCSSMVTAPSSPPLWLAAWRRRERRGRRGMWGGWGDKGGLRRREGQSDFNSSVKRTKKN